MTDNFGIFAKGLSDLTAGLTGGGTEARVQERLQQLADQAAMERLLKQNELKQQAEAAAEEQRQQKMAALTALLHSATGGRSTPLGPNEAGPVDPQASQSLDPYAVSAAYADLDPKAGASIFNSTYGQQLGAGIIDNPAFGLERNESNAQVGASNAQAYASRQHGNLFGAQRQTVDETRPWDVLAAKSDANRKDIQRGWEDAQQAAEEEEKRARAKAALSLAGVRDSTKEGKDISNTFLPDKLSEEINNLQKRGQLTDSTRAKVEQQTATELLKGQISREVADQRLKLMGAQTAKVEAQTANEGKRGTLLDRQVDTEGQRFSTEQQRTRGAAAKAANLELDGDIKRSLRGLTLAEKMKKIEKLDAETSLKKKYASKIDFDEDMATRRENRLDRALDAQLSEIESKKEVDQAKIQQIRASTAKLKMDLMSEDPQVRAAANYYAQSLDNLNSKDKKVRAQAQLVVDRYLAGTGVSMTTYKKSGLFGSTEQQVPDFSSVMDPNRFKFLAPDQALDPGDFEKP